MFHFLLFSYPQFLVFLWKIQFLYFYLSRGLCHALALIMSYYTCVFLSLFLSAFPHTLFLFLLSLSLTPPLSLSVLSSFFIFAPFLSLQLCLSVCLCKALFRFPHLGQFLTRQLAMSTSSSSGGLILIMFITFLSQILATKKPSPTKSEAVTAVATREMRMSGGRGFHWGYWICSVWERCLDVSWHNFLWSSGLQ